MVGARVSMSDMGKWIKELTTGEGALTDSEINDFYRQHLARNVMNCYQRGLTKEGCYEELLRGLQSDGNQPTTKGLEKVGRMINISYAFMDAGTALPRELSEVLMDIVLEYHEKGMDAEACYRKISENFDLNGETLDREQIGVLKGAIKLIYQNLGKD